MTTSPSKKISEKIILPNFDDFLLYLKTNNYSEETIYNYERDLSIFNYFLIEDSPTIFKKINRRTIENYKAYLISRDRKLASGEKSEKKLAPRSINRNLSALRSYLRYLIDVDYRVPIAPEVIKLVKTERKHAQVAELEDLIRLIEAPSALEKNQKVAFRNRAVLEVLFSTGMRISELASLNRNQIDNSGKIFIMGKGKKERFVYLTPRAKSYLERYLLIRDDSCPALFIPYSGLNAGSRKRRLSTNYIQAKIKKYRESRVTIQVVDGAFLTERLLELINISFFDLNENSLVVYLLEAGRDVQEFISASGLGSSSIFRNSVFIPIGKRLAGKGRMEKYIDPLSFEIDSAPESVLVIDDVVASGETMSLAKNALRAKLGFQIPFYFATWVYLATGSKFPKDSPSGIRGFEKGVAAMAVRGNTGIKRPPINSLSCFLDSDRKSPRVVNSYASKYFPDREWFYQALNEIKEVL